MNIKVSSRIMSVKVKGIILQIIITQLLELDGRYRPPTPEVNLQHPCASVGG